MNHIYIYIKYGDFSLNSLKLVQKTRIKQNLIASNKKRK